jgi:hypothetical protein
MERKKRTSQSEKLIIHSLAFSAKAEIKSDGNAGRLSRLSCSGPLLRTSMSKKIHLQLPAHSNELKVSLPEEHVLLLTLNRPKFMNAMTPTLHNDINNLLNWFDDEPNLW